MTGVLFYLPNARQLSNVGVILPGWKAQFYYSQTTILAPVYADGDLDDELTNPVVADAAGTLTPVYLDPDIVYRVQLYTSSNVLIEDVDPFDVQRLGQGASANATYLTTANELTTLPSSRRLVAGTNITFDDAVAGVRTLNVGGSLVAECVWVRNNTNTAALAVALDTADLSIIDTVPGIHGMYKASLAHLTGAYYFEVTIVTLGASGTPTVGGVQMNSSGQVGDNGSGTLSTKIASWGLMANSGDKYHGSLTAYGSSLSVNDVLMVAIDLTNHKIWWGKNGTWFASGNPAAGTNAAFTNLADWIYPAVSLSDGASVTANFGASAFTYTPPTGFLGWAS